MLTREEIQKRLQEVSGKLTELVNDETKLTSEVRDVQIAEFKGEIWGLSWVLTYWESGYYGKEVVSGQNLE